MTLTEPLDELFTAIDKHATDLEWTTDGSTYHARIADVEISAQPTVGHFPARVHALGIQDDIPRRIERIVTAAQTQIVQRMLDSMAGESAPEPENGEDQ